MARLASKTNGNFTASATWGVLDTTVYLNSQANNTALTTSYVESSAGTPGAITIDGIGVRIASRSGSPTGTISVRLALAGVTVTGTEVTIDVADLPACATADTNGGWIFFKFASPVLLLAATSYTVSAKTSSSSMVNLYRDSTAGNWSRFLRTTTEAAPGAGDVCNVLGDKTGSGAGSDYTVTMNETAATDYGNITIHDGGTLQYGTAAATNYILRTSAAIEVFSGGVMNIGTTGTPIPRDSTAVLEFDCTSDGEFGVVVYNLGTFRSQGLSRTSGKNIVSCKLNTDEAANSTSLGVDTDTGWLDNDLIAVASTTRTASDSEQGTMNGNAGASSLTVDGFGGAGGGLLVAHSGISPTQAEVILLTRNVKIRSVTSTLMAYLNFKATATIDIDWTEFRYIGENTTGKKGIEIETTTGSCNIAYSSFYNCEDQAVFITGSSANNITVDNCVFYDTNSSNSNVHALAVNNATSGTSISVTNCTFIKHGTQGNMINTADAGITITDVTMVSCGNTASSSGALVIGESAATVMGTFSNITAHSNALAGFACTSKYPNTLTITNLLCWRNNGSTVGGAYIAGLCNALFVSPIFFGNANVNVYLGSNINNRFDDGAFHGDTTFSTPQGVTLNGSEITHNIVFNNCDFGTAAGIKTTHSTADLALGNSICGVDYKLNNCKLASTTEFQSSSMTMAGSQVTSQNHDQTAGSHKTWKTYGIITSDTAISRTASPSERLTPDTASYKLESGSKKVAVASGDSVTISVYIRESVTGDGTDYNGSRPRLILKRNSAAGITVDTIIDTGTVSAEGAFEQLTGTTATVSSDAVLEFVVDCDGTTGWVNIDDWSAS